MRKKLKELSKVVDEAHSKLNGSFVIMGEVYYHPELNRITINANVVLHDEIKISASEIYRGTQVMGNGSDYLTERGFIYIGRF